MRAAVFILSDVRSGSTLLDQCLGAHGDVVSLGEVHWLRAYVQVDRAQYNPAHELVCACGQRVGECSFWAGVEHRLERPLDTLTLHSRFARPQPAGDLAAELRYLPRRIVRLWPSLYRLSAIRRVLGARRLARDSIELLEAACAVTGRAVCIDSSKSPFRFRAAYGLDPGRVRAIVLARDFRAVVHSKMKRGASLEVAAEGWRIALKHIDALTRDLPTSHVHRLKYEELCDNPRAVLARLSRFLGLEFSEAMLRRQTTVGFHHIGGSPSKFDSSRADIRLDDSYLDACSEDDILRMRRIVGAEAAKWSY
jgi:hypothetical protein